MAPARRGPSPDRPRPGRGGGGRRWVPEGLERPHRLAVLRSPSSLGLALRGFASERGQCGWAGYDWAVIAGGWAGAGGRRAAAGGSEALFLMDDGRGQGGP